jgi:hypothetical protein
MNTLRLFSHVGITVPAATSWYLADLGEARGKQELFILKAAYKEFAERVGDIKAPRGAKTEQILAGIGRFVGEFTVSQLEQACPGISRDMIRRVLREQQAVGAVECQGRGPAARWRRKG